MATSTWVLLSAALATSCSAQDEKHPPEFDAGSTSGQKTCAEIRAGTPAGGFVQVDGVVATCFADGLSCPVADLPAFAEICVAPSTTVARCDNERWTLVCSTSDASAGPADAAADAIDDGAGSA